jgi:photosystem II stability/assembly factor-like uncharacterized protein
MNMVDEIELVRQFRSDVPEPAPQVRAQAWAAVMAVAGEERTLAPAASPHRWTPPRKARQVAALAVAAAAIAAVLIAVLLVGIGPRHAPGAVTTSWQPSRPSSRPVSARGSHNPAGGLRLVSYIEGPVLEQGSKQVPPGYLDCPATDACYLLAQTVLSTVGPFPNYYNAVYFSGDGGASWSALALPAGLELTAPLSCPSALACVDVGSQGNKAELVSTSDGGHRWTVSPLRAPADVMALSCSSVSSCSLVTDASYLGPGNPQQFASTTDGGASWYTHNFASRLYISSFACPSAGNCIAIASTVATGAASTLGLGTGTALLTTDGGRSWSRSPLPSGSSTPLAPTEPGDLSLLACSDRENCLLFGGNTVTYSLQGDPSLPRHCPPDGCVLHEQATWHPDVASTADGGHSWQVQTGTSLALGSFTWDYTPGEPGYPARAISAAAGPDLGVYDLSCPSAGHCWLSTPYRSFALLQTTDAGSHWATQPLSDKQGLLQVSCPQPHQCVALGAPTATFLNHQTLVYGNSVPVYTSITTGR